MSFYKAHASAEDGFIVWTNHRVEFNMCAAPLHAETMPPTTPAEVVIKHAREAPAAEDGARVLVDRLWPRGVSKVKLPLDLWLKDVAPSAELRIWFGHRSERWEAFAKQYRVELKEKKDALRLLDEMRRRGRVSLLYDAHDPIQNHATVLREVLNDERFLPPLIHKEPDHESQRHHDVDRDHGRTRHVAARSGGDPAEAPGQRRTGGR